MGSESPVAQGEKKEKVTKKSYHNRQETHYHYVNHSPIPHNSEVDQSNNLDNPNNPNNLNTPSAEEGTSCENCHPTHGKLILDFTNLCFWREYYLRWISIAQHCTAARTLTLRPRIPPPPPPQAPRARAKLPATRGNTKAKANMKVNMARGGRGGIGSTRKGRASSVEDKLTQSSKFSHSTQVSMTFDELGFLTDESPSPSAEDSAPEDSAAARPPQSGRLHKNDRNDKEGYGNKAQVALVAAAGSESYSGDEIGEGSSPTHPSSAGNTGAVVPRREEWFHNLDEHGRHDL